MAGSDSAGDSANPHKIAQFSVGLGVLRDCVGRGGHAAVQTSMALRRHWWGRSNGEHNTSSSRQRRGARREGSSSRSQGGSYIDLSSAAVERRRRYRERVEPGCGKEAANGGETCEAGESTVEKANWISYGATGPRRGMGGRITALDVRRERARGFRLWPVS
ncbi:hypothetical protein OIDMADRAFT_25215 [Oidiodendron maius Zn]|uniref:Uncharacterized protein n=1 Tax=Oidiodendron maius (strain Zn) TaxID=913774 RepID=A0A0C3H8J1_OIDMZ|nr:hypothetical protein OIDMADRAFT_25215 [Oidiodendron maius Zn]